MKHFLYVPFTGLGLFQGYRGDTWLKNRIEVFKRFVLPSLLNQTNKDFYLWLSFRPEEESNPIVIDLINHLDKFQLKGTVVTFGGVMFWDDKYPDDIAEQRLRHSLSITLPQLKGMVGGHDVLMTLQPSDDLYLDEAVEYIQKVNKSMVFTKGYIMNYNNLDLAEYNPTTFPPFSTIKFTASQFLDPDMHYTHTQAYKSHEYVPVEAVIAKRMFIVGTHGENISTTWGHSFTGKMLTGREKDKVLISAGLFDVEPIILKKDFSRRLKKRIINVFPASLQRAIISAKSPGVKGSIKSYKYFNL